MTHTSYDDARPELIYAFAGGRRVAAVERDGVGTATDPGSSETFQFFHPDFVGSNTLVTEPSGWVQKTYPEPFGRIDSVRSASGLNAYTYVRNRPTVRVDPTGATSLCFGPPFCGGFAADPSGGIRIQVGLGLPVPGSGFPRAWSR